MDTISASLPRTAVLIVNAKSRKGRDLFEQARGKLAAAGIELSAAYALKDPSRLEETVKGAVDSGAPMVIVGGGDGSLSASVDHLVGRDVAFALLPLGTANSFARTLGIPLDLDGAVNVVANGVRRRIDLGMIDDDYFANCATLGLAPLVAETVPNELKRLFGRLGYLVWASMKMVEFRPFRLTIGEGDAAETVDALEVRIANGPYHGGAELVEEADVASGEIVVQVVEGRARSRLLWSWLATLLKLHRRMRATRTFRAVSMRISTDPPLPISIDGEILAHTPVVAKVARGVIEVAAPAPERQEASDAPKAARSGVALDHGS
jgi:YegS/Rv2252/BmrU family lipid kinase